MYLKCNKNLKNEAKKVRTSFRKAKQDANCNIKNS